MKSSTFRMNKYMLTPEKKSEHRAKKTEKQLKKIILLEKKYVTSIEMGFLQSAERIKKQIHAIRGQIEYRDAK